MSSTRALILISLLAIVWAACAREATGPAPATPTPATASDTGPVATASTAALPELPMESVGALAFSPEGVLFVGDSQAAKVVAIDLSDEAPAGDMSPVDVEKVEAKLAARLGVDSDNLGLFDMAVHPKSQAVYLSVSRVADGEQTPALVRIDKAGNMDLVSLAGKTMTEASIAGAPARDATDKRGRGLRTNTITDLAFADGRVFVAGLSNEEFASTFRRLEYPFTSEQKASSLEIYHVAHGTYETHAPIRTFMPMTLGGETTLLAAYTCTPLVTFAMTALEPGKHVRGKTIAELGWGNVPLDMISFRNKKGAERILIANSRRNVMLLDPADFAKADHLAEPLPEDEITVGVDYLSLPVNGTLQLDRLNDEHFVVLQRDTLSGALNLRSLAFNRF